MNRIRFACRVSRGNICVFIDALARYNEYWAKYVKVLQWELDRRQKIRSNAGGVDEARRALGNI